MIQKQQIIISYFRQGISQRKISRELSISRKTVKKYIDEYKTECQCPNKDSKGIIRVPRYDSSSRTRPKLTEQICARIDQFLRDNERKRQTGLAKQCMRFIDMHEVLQLEGMDISYSSVCE